MDCLRGAAILAVVGYHFLYRFEPGYLLATAAARQPAPLWLGVELFFVVSGFCIAFTLARSRSATQFWAQRLARLQPAYMAAAALSFAVVSAFGLPGREVGVGDMLANLVWLNAAGLAPHVDGVYWSLVVELKFYLMIGLIWLVCRDGRTVTLLWAAVCVASFVAFKVDPAIARQAFLYPFNVFFLFGLLLFNARSMGWLEQAACVAVTLAGVATASRYAPVIAPTLLTLGLAGALVHMRRIPGSRALRYVGLVSFAWYLIHQNIGVVIIRGMNANGFELAATSAAVVVTFALAAALHHALELRFRAALARRILSGLDALRVEAALEAAAQPLRAATAAVGAWLGAAGTLLASPRVVAGAGSASLRR